MSVKLQDSPPTLHFVYWIRCRIRFDDLKYSAHSSRDVTKFPPIANIEENIKSFLFKWDFVWKRQQRQQFAACRFRGCWVSRVQLYGSIVTLQRLCNQPPLRIVLIYFDCLRWTLCGFRRTRCEPRLGNLQRNSQRSGIRRPERLVSAWNGLGSRMGNAVQRWGKWGSRCATIRSNFLFRCFAEKYDLVGRLLKVIEGFLNDVHSAETSHLTFSPENSRQATQTKTMSRLDRRTSLEANRRSQRPTKRIPSRRSEKRSSCGSRHQKQNSFNFDSLCLIFLPVLRNFKLRFLFDPDTPGKSQKIARNYKTFFCSGKTFK